MFLFAKLAMENLYAQEATLQLEEEIDHYRLLKSLGDV
jgi:hypothetical protein